MAAELSELRALFVDEAREYVQLLNNGMLRLEAAPDNPDVLNELFRAVHSLKGMAGTMGYTAMVRLAHAMESVLDELRSGSGRIPAGPDLFDLLFAAASALEALVDKAAEGARPDEVDPETAAAVDQLVGALQGQATPAPESSAVEATSPEADGQGRVSIDFLGPERADRLRQAMEQGRSLYLVEVRLAPGCVFKGVRAYTILRALGQVGEVLGTRPAWEALEDDRFDDRFEVALATEHPAADLERAVLGVSEVAQVRALPATGAGQPARGRAALPGDARAPLPSPAPGAVVEGVKAPSVTPRESTVRIETGRLDSLVDLVGELVITTNQLRDAFEHRRLPEEAQVNKLGRVTSDLQNAVMGLRMVPLRQVFGRFPRMVRDLARRSGKQVVLAIEGEQTELDRNIVNEIGEPLVHLIRNAVDHGIEPPDQRVAMGKPPAGRVRLAARHEGNHVVIEVEDDGAGISIDRIRQKAIATGRMSAEQAQAASAEELLQLIFEPGFSTARRVTDVSGRGVGMDAAKAVVESLGGRIAVHTRAGRGTLFLIRLPLTLAIMRALMVETAGEVYALPTEVVHSIERVPPRVERVHGRPVLRYRGSVIPLISLRERLGLGGPTSEEGLAVVLSGGRRLVAAAVERVAGMQEVVIRNLSGLAGVPGVAGATILGSGRVALILDALWLV